MKKLTLKDVAAKLNVSTATVSNAFNRPDQLSQELRVKILHESDELGYFGPNAAARSLRVGQLGIIGVVLAECLQYNFSDFIATTFLSGVAGVFDQHGVNLLLLPGRREFYQDRTIETLADSFILYGPPHDPDFYRRLSRQNKKMVTVDFDLPTFPFIHVDNLRASYILAEHVLAKPANQVAILGLKLVPSETICRIQSADLFSEHQSISRQRLNGFQKFIQEKTGQALQDIWIWSLPESDVQIGYLAAKEALMCHPRPDVLLCMSDQIALGAMKACKEIGLAIPTQVRITGFDDIPEAEAAGLTTMHQPQKLKGTLAAEILLGLKSDKSLILNTRLVVRTST